MPKSLFLRPSPIFATLCVRSVRLRVGAILFGIAGLCTGICVNAQPDAQYENLLRKGIAARTANNLPQAVRLLREAVQLSPGDPRGALELAVAHEWSGQLDLAQKVYREFLRFQPDNAGAYLGLARVLRWQRHYDNAAFHYQRVLQSPEATGGMQLEAHLGLVQIDRLEMRLAEARARLEPLLARYQDDSLVKQEDDALTRAARHTLAVAVGERAGAAGPSTSLSAEWATKISANGVVKGGLARNMFLQPTLPTDTPAITEQTVAYAEIGSFAPLGRAMRARAEYRTSPRLTDEYLLLGEWSDALTSDWRANAGLTVAGPLNVVNTTVSGGLSRNLGKGLEAGLTTFVAATPFGSNQVTWLARAGWENEGTVVQAFVSRATDQSDNKYTALVRWPVAPGYQFRMQLGRDAVNDITSLTFGLDISIGPRMGMTIQRDVAGTDRAWTLGANFALPAAEALPKR